jgi:hypothetical protein
LNAEGLRDGTIGLAPLYAVLSFLRQESDDAYAIVTARAGGYAAEWTVQSMRPFTRAWITRLPPFARRRVLLRHAKALVRMSYDASRATSHVRRTRARIIVQTSVFCSVRETVAQPLCGYYAAAYERILAMFDVPAPVTVESCKASGGDACVLTISFAAPSDQPEAA